MFAGQKLGADRFRRVIEIDAVDLVAGHHDVVDRDFFQIEDAGQHLPVALGDHRRRLRDHGAQFFAAELWRRGRPRLLTEQSQNAVGYQVHRGHHRKDDFSQWFEYPGCRKGDLLGVQRGEGLGRDFRKNQGQESHDTDRDRNPGFAEQAQGDDRRDRGREVVDQQISEQDQAEQPVGSLEQATGALCAVMSLVAGEMPQPVAVERHQRRFRAREKRRAENAQHECAAQRAQGDFVQRVMRLTPYTALLLRPAHRPVKRGGPISTGSPIVSEHHLEDEFAAEVGEREDHEPGETPAYRGTSPPPVSPAAPQ